MRKQTWPIPNHLANSYHGAGWALAAVLDGKVVRIVYLDDVLPDFDPDNVQSAITSEEIAPTVRELQALGAISVGMLSGWEFTEC